MKRHEILIPLSHQHHSLLILSQLIKKDSPPYKNLPTELHDKRVYTLNKFRDEIVPHFEAEELILIPFILGKNKRIDFLSEEIVGEHKKISELMELIRKEVDLEENLDKLGNLLSIHIRKEERELFQLVQEVFSEEQLTKLLNQFSHLNKPQSC
ncbi:hypothetical protein ASZ90_003426 [hydrocarbon metagenome]|uniref:Hemerythrin-like domain-containing protein n=1 Tax=hydrocarbon metagenome TaxID=938273 RepID=A0A0W8G0N3_9ZZZZ